MKRPAMTQDVENLTRMSLVAEANESVWSAFRKAMSSLPEETRQVLEGHFEGASAEQLARAWNVTPVQMRSWIKKGKQQLIQTLRTHCVVRQ